MTAVPPLTGALLEAVLVGLLAQAVAATASAAAHMATIPPRILNLEQARIYPTVAANNGASYEWC
jgi:hypothetical protein